MEGEGGWDGERVSYLLVHSLQSRSESMFKKIQSQNRLQAVYSSPVSDNFLAHRKVK